MYSVVFVYFGYGYGSLAELQSSSEYQSSGYQSFWLLVPCGLEGLSPFGPPGALRTGGTQSFWPPGTLRTGGTPCKVTLGVTRHTVTSVLLTPRYPVDWRDSVLSATRYPVN